MTHRIGLLVGREWSWPPAFIEEVNKRDADVVAEFAQVGGDDTGDTVPYDVLIDRISHEVPMYRSYLKKAVLEGKTVVNNPFMWTADDKFFGAALVEKMGIASPKTVVLPNREYVPGIVPTESLRNLRFPLDWKAITDHIGWPLVLKDAHGGGWKAVHICHTMDELIHHYNHSGLLTMILQEFIEWEQFVRCLCVGQEEILPMHYDPKARKYIVDDDYLTPAMRERIVGDSRRICQALGYDMNSIEYAVKDGVPYAIDFMNCAPDMDIYSLTPTYFEWAVTKMANMSIRLARAPRPQLPALRWDALFRSSRA